MQKKKLVLLILDGWGYSEEVDNNAIRLANTPNMDKYWDKYPHALLQTSGLSVGLPGGQMGTSEVNHMTIGAGRVIFQDLVKINKAIETDEISRNEAVISAMEHVKKNNSTLHLQGLLSTGGVHSHQDHFYAMLSLAKRIGIKKVMVHVFTDGRDTSPHSAKKFVKELEDFMDKLGIGQITTIVGRYYAMDRDENWDRVQFAYDAITQSKGEKYTSALEAIEAAYERGETDEFIKPIVIERDSDEPTNVTSNDAVIFLNFRSDRAVEITQKFLESGIENLKYTAMAQYKEGLNCEVAFPAETVENTLGEVLSNSGYTQLRITETEKFQHLTYFLNCKKQKALEGEDRIMLDSYSDIATHDERPKMRAEDITREIIQDIECEVHDVIISNICNADMVGHTANVKPIIQAVECVDECVGRIVAKAKDKGYAIIITADHGNAERIFDPETGEPDTAHTTNDVPLIFISDDVEKLSKEQSDLTAIAPTILNFLGLPKPEEMTGESLI